MREAPDLDVRTVGIYSKEDRLALHRFKADESYMVGEGKKPLAAYLEHTLPGSCGCRARSASAVEPGLALINAGGMPRQGAIAARGGQRSRRRPAEE
ncbi:biotin carboxylase N-terminal domain-containing protein [Cupriavidus sp. BIC8F]|uniref:biotin carboxylase N-terminal domain-containing protein n=1 Tax=Cupriavidus sp. BIC8F TaxID=3079014 RepID=UPI0039674078